jgi:hypothetical protein
MEIYDSKYICNYTNSNIFTEDEDKLLNEHEKIFVRDALYRQDFLNIFKLYDEEFNDEIVEIYIKKLYKFIKNDVEFKICMSKIAEKLLSTNLKLGLMLLFSFDYLYLVHPCICNFIEGGKITDENLNNLKQLIF